MAKTVDVAQVIGSQRFGPFQLMIVALCGMIQFLDGFDTQALAYAAPALRAAWNLRPDALGQAFALGAFGTGLGSVFLGLLADILGRRKVMIVTVTIFGVLTFGTAFLTSIGELQIWRLLTGFGLGAALPLTFVIANEFAPLKIRARMISFMACGFAFGALSGGLLEAALVPYLGWQAIFYIGGIVPLLLALALLLFLPESIRFLATRDGNSREIAKIFRRMNHELDYPDDTIFIVPAEPKRQGFQPVQLFTEKRSAMTLCLWLVFLMTLAMLNTLNNWLPVAINMAGLPGQRAVVMTTLFQFGGIAGVLSLGALADRVGYHRVLITAYAILAFFIAAIGLVGSAQLAIAVAVAGTGLFLVGANNTLGAFASTLYPTAIRATGVSWGSSFGRLAGSLGPLFGGILLQRLPLQQTFLIFAVPALIASLGVLGMLKVRQKPEPLASAHARA
ncbi:MAG TPA: MFS transporter [Micropepsaceae bacterium]|nr:MFS transporter [Micropepsaceae bacterium]